MGVALDSSTNAYLTGSANSTDFPVTKGAFQSTRRGSGDAFVAKVISLCTLSTANPSVTICTPGSNATVKSPVTIIAGTYDTRAVRLTQVYVDGAKAYQANLGAIDVALAMTAGTHRVTVQAFDTANVAFKKTILITVSP